MSLKLYNSLSKKEEIFEPLNPPHVSLYTCGPTVYNYPHIGNYRAYIFGDLLKRTLIYSNFKVKHIMNITDVDDKTIKNSQLEKKKLSDFTQFYTKSFLEDINKLNIIRADKYTYATDYIKEMLELIEILLNKGFAYKSDDGSIYFNIKKDKNYGKLSHFKISDLKENALGRLISDEYDKENAQDFALWKAWTKEDGEVFWIPKDILDKETIIEKGRPGWHIECSAMSMSELGESFDIHTGGVDNIFPHHENEITQSECATGKPFSKYFMHNEFLLVDGKKMSKSLNNFYTLSDLIKKEISPLAFRLWLQTSHYRKTINFTIETLIGTQIALNRLNKVFLNLGNKIGKVDEKYKNKFTKAISNDLDTPKAISILWDLVKDKDIKNENKKATMLNFDLIFGLGFDKLRKKKNIIIPKNIEKLIKERETARKGKNWEKSDVLRDKIKTMGYIVKDSSAGSVISLVKK